MGLITSHRAVMADALLALTRRFSEKAVRILLEDRTSVATRWLLIGSLASIAVILQLLSAGEHYGPTAPWMRND